MDKQLIERIAPLVLAAIDQSLAFPSPSEKIAISESITALVIARIDAERGKEARAWLLDDGGYCFTDKGAATEFARLNNFSVKPLFLSAPTIPEGWALVPIEPTEEMIKAGAYENGCQAVSRYLVLAVWKDMIAAKGEHK